MLFVHFLDMCSLYDLDSICLRCLSMTRRYDLNVSRERRRVQSACVCSVNSSVYAAYHLSGILFCTSNTAAYKLCLYTTNLTQQICHEGNVMLSSCVFINIIVECCKIMQNVATEYFSKMLT